MSSAMQLILAAGGGTPGLPNPTIFTTPSSNSYVNFGFASSVSGNLLIVGGPGENGAGVPAVTSTGAAYIYNASTGSLLFTLTDPRTPKVANDRFGRAVGISGTLAIIGSAYPYTLTEPNVGGKAYIYNASTGALLFALDNPDPNAITSDFGISVSISNNLAAVGAPRNNQVDADPGKVYVYNATNGSLLYTLTDPNPYGTTNGDFFGYSVSMTGTYLIVGAPYEDSSTFNNTGKAYVYDAPSGTLLYTFNNPDPNPVLSGDNFGWSVSASGNYAVVGAPNESGPAGGSPLGRAYVYNLTTGLLMYGLTNPDATPGRSDQFGYTVLVFGNSVIIGSPYFDNDDRGKVYIYNVSSGTLLYTINDPNVAGSTNGDNFGYSLSMSATRLIVGAPGETGPSTGSGKVYMYNIPNATISYELINPTPAFDARFGFAVSSSGGLTVVGAPGLNINNGLAFVYNTNTGNIVSTLDPLTSTNGFGSSVGISNGLAIVGSPGYSIFGAYQCGIAYIYNASTGVKLLTINNPTPAASDRFGAAVAISSGLAIIGAPYKTDIAVNSGKAYIYNSSNGGLIHTLNNPTPVGTGLNDNFGLSVAISGTKAIVGAPYEDSYPDSGRAYVYDTSTGSLLFTLASPGANAYVNFGKSVAIAGNLAVVGAPYEIFSPPVTQTGAAYVYNITTGNLLFTLYPPYDGDTGWFGESVAISNNLIAIGRPLLSPDPSDPSNYAGAVYLYSTTTGQLVQTINRLNNSTNSNYEYFGKSVAIPDDNSNNVVIGSGEPNEPYGYAFIYQSLV